jgi:hypothetical protein
VGAEAARGQQTQEWLPQARQELSQTPADRSCCRTDVPALPPQPRRPHGPLLSRQPHRRLRSAPGHYEARGSQPGEAGRIRNDSRQCCCLSAHAVNCRNPWLSGNLQNGAPWGLITEAFLNHCCLILNRCCENNHFRDSCPDKSLLL